MLHHTRGSWSPDWCAVHTRWPRCHLVSWFCCMQSVLRNIERQIQDFQRQQQQQDLQSELEHHHKLPVDIQIGDQVILQTARSQQHPPLQ